MNENAKERKTDTLGPQNINDKLDSAAKVLDDARAEARARLAEERRVRQEAEKNERVRAAAQEVDNRASAERIENIMAQKRVQNEYAESQRRSLGTDKRRERTASEADTAKKVREEEQRLRVQASAREQNELLKRNSDTDRLISSVYRRVEQTRGASVRAQANEKAELERMLAAADLAKNDVIAEREREANEAAKEHIEREKAEKEAELKLAEEARLRIEAMDREQTKTETPEVIIQDGMEFIRGIPEQEQKKDVTVIDGIEFIRGIPEDAAASREEVPIRTTESKDAHSVEDIKIGISASDLEDNSAADSESVGEKDVGEQDSTEAAEYSAEKTEAAGSDKNNESEPLWTSILGSTYSMMTAKTGFEEKYEKKREAAEAAIRSSDAEPIAPVKRHAAADEPRIKYDFDAGYVIKPEEESKADKRNRRKEEKQLRRSMRKEGGAVAEETDEIVKKPIKSAIPVANHTVKVSIDQAHAVPTEAAASTNIAPKNNTGADSEAKDTALIFSDARLEALKEEKRRKEEAIEDMEAANAREIAALKKNNYQAKANYVNAGIAAAEEAYRKDIISLNEKIKEIEAEHEAKRRYYESSTEKYKADAINVHSEYDGASDSYSNSANGTEAYEITDTLPTLSEDFDKKGKKKKKERTKDKRSKRGERDDLSYSDEYAGANEKRAMLDDYKEYRKKYGDGDARPNESTASDEMVFVSDEDAELRKKYAKYFVDEAPTDSAPMSRTPSVTDEVLPRPEYRGETYDTYTPVSAKTKHSDADYRSEIDEQISKDEADRKEYRDSAEDEAHVHSMTRRELRRHLSSSAKEEKNLTRTIDRAERKYAKAHLTEKPEKLTAVMTAKKELFALYASNYIICTASGAKGEARRFGKSARRLVKDYNSDLSRYEKMADERFSPVSDPVEYIKKHNTPPTLPVPKPSGVGEDDGLNSTKAKKREKLSVAKEDAKRNRKQSRRSRADTLSTVKRQIANDELCAAACIEYRINRYDYEITKRKFHFGDETGADKRERKKTLAKLKSMRSGKKSSLKHKAEDNARYLEVAVADANELRIKRDSDRDRLSEIIERVGLLLTERDGINRRLDSLYRENESVFSSSKNTRKRITELKLAVARKTFKKQMKEYRRISKYRIPLKEKQVVYDLMNEKIELTAYEAELRFRLKTEHPRKDARRDMRNELRETVKELRATDRAISSQKKKLASRDERKNPKKNQLVWLMVLILITALAALTVIFFKEETVAFFGKAWEFFVNLFKKKA